MLEETEPEVSRSSQVLEEGREQIQGILCQDGTPTEVVRPRVKISEERLQRTERKNWIARVGQEIRKRGGMLLLVWRL